MNVRTASIYSIHIDINQQINLLCNTKEELLTHWKDTIKSKSDKNSDKNNVYTTPINNKKDNYDIYLSIYFNPQEENIFFGTLSKRETLADKPLQQVKDTNNKIVDTSNLRIENYTYFYFDLEKLQVVVLSNEKAPKFKRHFQTFLTDLAPTNGISITVINTLSDNFNEKLNRTANLLSASFIFDDSSKFGMNNMNLKDACMISNKNIEKITLSIKYRKTAPSSLLSDKELNILKDKGYMKESCSKAEIRVSDNDEDEIILDAVDRYLRKKISLNLNDRDLLDYKKLDKIKKSLASVL